MARPIQMSEKSAYWSPSSTAPCLRDKSREIDIVFQFEMFVDIAGIFAQVAQLLRRPNQPGAGGCAGAAGEVCRGVVGRIIRGYWDIVRKALQIGIAFAF
ncbi:MAG: hypothetical protein LBJ23_11560, partial [Tannerella sp.]|nr:hypothetical protein [Tannerella sp.]